MWIENPPQKCKREYLANPQTMLFLQFEEERRNKQQKEIANNLLLEKSGESLKK